MCPSSMPGTGSKHASPRQRPPTDLRPVAPLLLGPPSTRSVARESKTFPFFRSPVPSGRERKIEALFAELKHRMGVGRLCLRRLKFCP